MTLTAEASSPPAWRNRIVGHAEVPPADLVLNPRNWRTHPKEQQRALAGSLAEVGWVAEVLVNRTTGHVVDGHLRIELALDRHEASVPVTYLELSQEEERLVLASLDPLAAMASVEEERLAALLDGLAPMSVIARRVDASVRADMKGQPREAIENAVYRATGDALFLFCLVFQINLDAVEMARVEGLRAGVVFFWMGSLLGGPRDEDLPPEELVEHDAEQTRSWGMWLSGVERLDWDVRVANGLRAALAERYYAGQDLLFADARTDWTAHVEQVERMRWFADAIGVSLRGKAAERLRAAGPALPTVEVGVADRMAWLTDQAKVRAYEVLGERPKAVAIMERRLLREHAG